MARASQVRQIDCDMHHTGPGQANCDLTREFTLGEYGAARLGNHDLGKRS